MEVAGWILDKSASARSIDPDVSQAIAELEQLYSARSARDHDALMEGPHASFAIVPPPSDIVDSALRLQQDRDHHHGLWHRAPIPDLLIAERVLHRGMG